LTIKHRGKRDANVVFVRILNNISHAIVNGESVSIPDAIDLQYAICSALVGRAISVKDKDNAQKVWGNICVFFLCWNNVFANDSNLFRLDGVIFPCGVFIH
jgi:hypothetical protein